MQFVYNDEETKLRHIFITLDTLRCLMFTKRDIGCGRAYLRFTVSAILPHDSFFKSIYFQFYVRYRRET